MVRLTDVSQRLGCLQCSNLELLVNSPTKSATVVFKRQHFFAVLRVSARPFYLSIIFLFPVSALDPHYIDRAKILDTSASDNSSEAATEGFEASAKKCRKVGEKAAKKRVSCVAETDFYETLSNRVHMSRIIPSEDDRELWDLAYKISKCAVRYSKYFEHACRLRTVYLDDRRRCRRLRTRQDRTRCKGQIQDKYHRRHTKQGRFGLETDDL